MRLIWPWQDRTRAFSWLKAGAFALVLAPGVRMIWQLYTNEFGILPMALSNLTFWSGVWATAVLLAALAVTPAAVVLRWGALMDARRMVGVAALVYTIAHVVIWCAMRSWNMLLVLNETVTRLTLILALVSTVGLIVLGATSFDAAIARMGTKGWQRLHNTNYIISALALLHVVLARGTYPEQYLLAGLFIWLMAWRVLARYRLGSDARALALLALGSGVTTALLEAGCFWARRGYEWSWTLGNNFSIAALDVGVPAAWQVFGYGLVLALAAAGREALRVRTAAHAVRQPG